MGKAPFFFSAKAVQVSGLTLDFEARSVGEGLSLLGEGGDSSRPVGEFRGEFFDGDRRANDPEQAGPGWCFPCRGKLA